MRQIILSLIYPRKNKIKQDMYFKNILIHVKYNTLLYKIRKDNNKLHSDKHVIIITKQAK